MKLEIGARNRRNGCAILKSSFFQLTEFVLQRTPSIWLKTTIKYLWLMTYGMQAVARAH